jgi:hypothetical protein
MAAFPVEPSRTVIYECLYQEHQEPTASVLRPLFIPNDRPDWRELQAFIKIHRNGDWKLNRFTGIFSPKFAQKSQISAEEFIRFSAENSAADVCLINPFPHLRYWSYNVWMQGEFAHPGLLERSQNLLSAVGIPWDLKTVPRHSAATLAYGNFWVASGDFWQSYVGEILEPIAQFLLTNEDHPAAKDILTGTRHTTESPFLPFMIERLFSTFISLDTRWKIASYSHTAKEVESLFCKNEFERLLIRAMRPEVDAADESGQFSPALIEKMHTMCGLFQQHFNDYYAHRVHPHTGRVFQPLV